MDFGGLADKAKDALSEHGDKVGEGLDKGAEFAKDKLGEDKAGAIDSVVDKAKGFLGDQQQDQQQDQQ